MKIPQTLPLSALKTIFSLLLFFAISPSAVSAIRVVDSTGQVVERPEPARRIVALAPHIAENLYSAGAGEKLVGVVAFADFPDAVKKLPSVGSAAQLDIERIVQLQPDLLIGWQSGNRAADIARLKKLGIPVYLSEARDMEDMAREIEDYGQMAGTAEKAQLAATKIRLRWKILGEKYRGRHRVKVFHQLWNTPLSTVGGKQILNQIISQCGGENVFSALTLLAPVVSVEAVIASQPEVIISTGMATGRPDWLDDWRRWQQIPAVQKNLLFYIHPDFLHRQTPRLLDGAEMLCGYIDRARL